MIRAFQAEDLDSTMEIWLAANTQAHSFLAGEYWAGHYKAVEAMLPQAELYVWEDDASGRIEGFIGLAGDYIAGLFVRDGARSQGIGKALLEQGKRLKGCLELRVYGKNQRAVQFYQREGFLIRAERGEEETGELEYVLAWRR